MRSKQCAIKQLAEPLALALALEASGYPKPGNVHRTSDRKGLRYEAFLATSILAVKYFERGVKRGRRGFGKTVLGDLVHGLVREVTEKLNSTNTCLGSSLLLSLMSVSLGALSLHVIGTIRELGGVSKKIVESTTVWDTIYYYKAVRTASPSYLKPDDHTGIYVNVWDPAYRQRLLEKGHRLVDVLKYSSKLDIVAREALNGFEQGLLAEEFMRERLNAHRDFNRAVVETYLYLLSRNRDTVVYLKNGISTAEEVSEKALRVLNDVIARKSGWRSPVKEFDYELVSRGINPGAVADLTATAIALHLLRNTLENGILLDLSY
ncbi:MAG: triphosphoribosyl-dephospho-CoA synthase [Desulfurococcaceae archaeon]